LPKGLRIRACFVEKEQDEKAGNSKLNLLKERNCTMKKLSTVMGIFMLVSVLVVAAFAQPGGRGSEAAPSGGPGWCPMYSARNSNLSDTQRAELDKLHQRFQNDTVGIRNELRSKRGQLHELLRTSNPDPEKATALQQEISGLEAQLGQRHLEFRLEARKIAPEGSYGCGYGRGHGGGYCKGDGGGHHMMGCSYGPGPCWN
jgi:zinc resistance-associated protein